MGGKTTSLAMGVAGGIIGGIVGGPAGAGFGWKAAMMGFSIGSILGSALFPNRADTESSPLGSSHVTGINVSTSSYGSVIKVVYGTVKIGGNLIWYDNFQTVPHYTTTEQQGGKGGGESPSTTTVTYTYTISLAYGICMGTADVLNIWAGDTLVDSSNYTVYDGTQTTADSHIALYTTRDPVYKHLCYVVFPNYDLGSSTYIPNFTFEVARIQEIESYDSDDTYVNHVYALDMSDGNALVIYDTSNLTGGTDYLKVALTKVGSGVNWKDYLTLESWLTSGGTAWVSYGSTKISDTLALIYKTTASYTNAEFDVVELDLTSNTLSALSSDNDAHTGKYSTFTAIEDDESGNARVLEIWDTDEGVSDTFITARVHVINQTTGEVTIGTTYTDSNAIARPNGTHRSAYMSSNKVLIAYCNDIAEAGNGPIYFMVLTVDASNVVIFGTSANTGASFSGYIQPIHDCWLNSECTEMIIPVVEDTNKTSYIIISISGSTVTVGETTRYPDTGTSYPPHYPNLIMSSATTGKLLCGSTTMCMKDLTIADETTTDAGGTPTGVTYAMKYCSAGLCIPDDPYVAPGVGDYFLWDGDVYEVLEVRMTTPSDYVWTEVYTDCPYIDYPFTMTICDGPTSVTTNDVVGLSDDDDVEIIDTNRTFNTLYENNNSMVSYNDMYFIFSRGTAVAYELTGDTLQTRETSLDVTPPSIAKEALTNDLYGLGLSSSYLNSTSVMDTGDFCIDNDLLISVCFDKQQSILDVLQYLVQYHDGYVSYQNGEIYYNQLYYNPSVNVVTYSERSAFSDTFDGTSIDTDKWIEYGTGLSGALSITQNNELIMSIADVSATTEIGIRSGITFNVAYTEVDFSSFSISGSSDSGVNIRYGNSDSGFDASPSLDVTSVANDLVVDMVLYWDSSDVAVLTPGDGQTKQFEFTSAGVSKLIGSCSTKESTSDSTTMSWTAVGCTDSNYSQCAVSICSDGGVEIDDVESPTPGELTWSHTVDNGCGMLIVLTGSHSSGGQDERPTGVTYGGVDLTLYIEEDRTFRDVRIYYLSNPTPGTANIVVSGSFPFFGCVCGSISLKSGSTSNGCAGIRLKKDAQNYVEIGRMQSLLSKEVSAIPLVSGDDSYTNTVGEQFVSNSYLVMGYYSVDYGDYHIYIRFPNIVIPKNATIKTAIIKFVASNIGGVWGNPTVNIYGNDVDSSTAPTSHAEFDALVQTTASSEWADISPKVAYETYYSPDITTIIQELVDREGWVSGNAIGIMLLSSTIGANRLVYARSYDSLGWDGSGVGRPLLDITYETSTLNEDIYYAKQVLNGVESDMTEVDLSDTSGSLKIARNYDDVTLYYDVSGTWTELESYTSMEGVANIELFCKAKSGITISCNFDNFKHYEGSNTIYPEHLIEEEYPVNVIQKGDRDHYNKIIAEFTNREKGYNVGTVIADDTLDIDDFGLKEKSINLDAFTTGDRTVKMANHILKKSLINPEAISFSLGINNLGLRPGDLRFLTDPDCEFYDQPIRISSVNEGEEYKVDVEALLEYDIYNLWEYDAASDEQPEISDIFAASLPIDEYFALEVPSLYSLTECKLAIACTHQSTDDACMGFSLYRSYMSGGTFVRLEQSVTAGIIGVVSAVTTDTITIVLETDYTLTSLTSFDEMMRTPITNLMMVRTSGGDIYLRFQTVTLVDTNTWLLEGLLYDLTGYSYVDITTGIAEDDEVLIFEVLTFDKSLGTVDKNRTLYLKVPTYNFAGTEISLADCTEESIAISALCDTPLAPFFIDVNGVGIDSSAAVTIGSGDIDVEWMSRNRHNDGATDYNFANNISDDLDFSTFRLLIYNGETLLRTVDQTEKTYSYTTALQTTDGGPYNEYIMQIYQISTMKMSTEYDEIDITVV